MVIDLLLPGFSPKKGEKIHVSIIRRCVKNLFRKCKSLEAPLVLNIVWYALGSQLLKKNFTYVCTHNLFIMKSFCMATQLVCHEVILHVL